MVNLLDVRLRARSCGPVLIPEDIVRYPRIKIRTLVPSPASPRLSPSSRVGCDASFCTRGSPNIVRALKVNARGALPRSYHLPPFPFPPPPPFPVPLIPFNRLTDLSLESLSTHANERLSLRIKWNRRIVIAHRLLSEKCSPSN